MAVRADQRKFHYTYKVTCTNPRSGDLRVFYNIHSTDNLEDGFKGAGELLYQSKREHGEEAHAFEILQQYQTRRDAKLALTELKAAQVINPKLPHTYKHHIVYKTVRFDGKFYIGVHSTNDLADAYLGSGTYLARSIKKYGKDKHTRETLAECESREAAFVRERELVSEALSDPNCMNIGSGGQGGAYRTYGVTGELRERISQRFKTIERTSEWCQKIGDAHRGKEISEEAKQKRLQTLKERGYKPTEETKAKQRAGQLSSEKFKQRRRAVVIDGVQYEYLQEAIDKLGLVSGCMAYRLKSPNWPTWRYADAPEKDSSLKSKRARGAYRMSHK